MAKCHVTLISLKETAIMTDEKPKIGNINALNEFVKKLADLRKQPLPKSVFDIVQENYDRNKKQKKTAKPNNDVEA